MDPIRPIEPRSPWIPDLAPVRAQGDRSKLGQREGRAASGRGNRKQEPSREPSREEGEPEPQDTEGRHIDVRA